jgi:hypothetical protein
VAGGRAGVFEVFGVERVAGGEVVEGIDGCGSGFVGVDFGGGFVEGGGLSGFVWRNFFFGRGFGRFRIVSGWECGGFGDGSGGGIDGEVATERVEVADEAALEGGEAVLVAEDEVHFLGGSEGFEGGEGAVDFGGGRDVIIHFAIEHAGFHGVATAETPNGGDELIDHVAFDVVLGLEAVDVGLDGSIKDDGVFVAQGDDTGEHAVLEGVLGGAGLTLV